MTLTVGSLFSGIGGLDLGLERAGMKVIWQSEIDPYACRVLAKHWPEVPNVGDIKRVDWRNIVRPDVICGGYPCQPFSHAGKRQGEEDPRHLWPWVREALRILRPRYAILENVRGHLSLGGSTVLNEITALGYNAEWRIVSAASVGANHRRDRIIIVAYPNRQNESACPIHELGMVADTNGSGKRHDIENIGEALVEKHKSFDSSSHRRRSSKSKNGKSLADTDSGDAADGGQREVVSSEDRSRGNDRGGSDSDPRQVTVRGSGEDLGDMADAAVERREERGSETSREVFAGNAWGRISDLGAVAHWWETEPNVGRVANGVSSRVDRLRGLGNAVVPQVAEVIGRLVVAHYETVTA